MVMPVVRTHLNKNSLEDTFSHRLDSQDIGWTQFNIARENLVRENFGSVYERKTRIKNNLAIDEILKKVSKKFNIKKIFFSFEKDYFLIGKNNIISLEERKKEYNETFDKEIIVEPEKREIFIEITTTNKEVYFSFEKDLINLGFIVLGEFDDEGGIPVTFAFPNARGIQYKTHSFSPVKFNTISQNYDEKNVKQVLHLIEDIKKAKNGIVLIHGKAGVGKTYLVRSIASEMDNRRVVVCSPPMQFLENAGLLNDVFLNFPKSLAIFEDIGDVLTVEGAVNHVNSRSNLLNMSEGLMSLLSNSIFVVTFNHDVSKIDPAILRSGRCLSDIEIEALKYEQAQKLVGFNIPKKEYTLAEVYVMKNSGKVLEKLEDEKKLGFGR